MEKKRVLALTLALSLLLTSCGGAKATAMHLRKTEGTVGVSDDGGKEVSLRDDLGLYSGYGVDTSSDSYAWIDLDSARLTKLDQNSELAITKAGKKLEIQVKSGNLFFNVTKPLADDESMNISTSTMLVGIRGTCGWMTQDAAALLEGTVEVTAGEQSATLSAGEMAVLMADGTLEVTEFSVRNIPAFVMEEIKDDDVLIDAILAASGLDLTDGVTDDAPAAYQNALAELEKEGEILYTEMVDFEADGNPELLVLHTRHKREERRDELLAVSVFRSGPDGTTELYFGTPRFDDKGSFSLVKYGDRTAMKAYWVSEGEVYYESESYDGSVAEKDGAIPSWSVDRDWGMLDWIYCTQSPYYGSTYTMTNYSYDGRGFAGGSGSSRITAEEYAAIQAKYTEEKVLAYSPDGKQLVILPEPSELQAAFPPAAAEAGPVTGFISWADAGLEDHVMDWRDEALAAKMTEVTGITGRDIMLSDVWELDYLELGSAGISDISALGELTNLNFLGLNFNDIRDISSLSSLTNLENLRLSNNDISDISALSSLTNLETLYLSSNDISDISALSGLTNLEELFIAVNPITDYSPVEFVPTLVK